MANGAGKDAGRLQGTVNLFRAWDQNFEDDNDQLNVSEIALEQNNGQADLKFDIGEGVEASDEGDDDFLNGGGGK